MHTYATRGAGELIMYVIWQVSSQPCKQAGGAQRHDVVLGGSQPQQARRHVMIPSAKQSCCLQG